MMSRPVTVSPAVKKYLSDEFSVTIDRGFAIVRKSDPQRVVKRCRSYSAVLMFARSDRAMSMRA